MKGRQQKGNFALCGRGRRQAVDEGREGKVRDSDQSSISGKLIQ